MERRWRSELQDLRIDLEKIEAGLPPTLRTFCALARGRMPLSEIAREMGVSRTTLYRYRLRVRRALEAAGLHEYLGDLGVQRPAVRNRRKARALRGVECR